MVLPQAKVDLYCQVDVFPVQLNKLQKMYSIIRKNVRWLVSIYELYIRVYT